MIDGPVRPDPADEVPPGERAALADTARDLVGERAAIADTARELIGERAALAATAGELVKSNMALADTVTRLTKKLRFRTRLIAAVLVTDLVITGGAFVLFEQVKTLVHESCTLYGFIIPSYRESARATSPLGAEGYDVFYRAMQVSADHLGCGIPHRI